jgi:hypothetical protein
MNTLSAGSQVRHPARYAAEIQGHSYRLQASLKAKKGGRVLKTPTT